jgi:hypothetical protein
VRLHVSGYSYLGLPALSGPLIADGFQRIAQKLEVKGRETRPRPISTAGLNTLPCVHLPPVCPVLYRRPYLLKAARRFILRRASRLDAFSASLFPT